MQRTGHSTTAGVHLYKWVGEKLHSITSEILNCNKKPKTEESVVDSDSKQDQFMIRDTRSDDKQSMQENKFSNVPVLNLGGATNFIINFNIGKDS